MPRRMSVEESLAELARTAGAREARDRSDRRLGCIFDGCGCVTLLIGMVIMLLILAAIAWTYLQFVVGPFLEARDAV